RMVHSAMSRLEHGYIAFLPKTLAHKGLVVLTAVVLLIGSVALIPFLGVELLPETDDGSIALNVTARPGLKLDALDEMIRPLEEMVAAHPDVDRYSLSAGSAGLTTSMSGLMGGTAASATLTAYLKDDRALSTRALVDRWREETAGLLNCEVSVSAVSTTSMMAGGSDIQISLQGTDLDTLEQTALQAESLMRENPSILQVSSSLSSGKPQVEIVVDPVKASAVGLVPAAVMQNVYQIMEGSEAGTLHQNNRDYSVRVEYPSDRFAAVSDLAGMTISSPMGLEVPLLDIASIEYSSGPQSISRKNSRYLITLSGQPASDAPDSLAADLNAQIAGMEMPFGVELTQSAASEQMQEEFSTLLGAIATAVFLVFMVMAMQFESPRFSIVVMLCVPFALVGSFGLLLLTGGTLSLVSLMGFLMLVGIVVNNGILFIDTTDRLRAEEG
ncbi:MAG: efflux RND transporter permease subunit, partial [Oscillospiraceae bacterium]